MNNQLFYVSSCVNFDRYGGLKGLVFLETELQQGKRKASAGEPRR